MEVKEIKKEVTITFDSDDICYLEHICSIYSITNDKSIFDDKCLAFSKALVEILERKV